MTEEAKTTPPGVRIALRYDETQRTHRLVAIAQRLDLAYDRPGSREYHDALTAAERTVAALRARFERTLLRGDP